MLSSRTTAYYHSQGLHHLRWPVFEVVSCTGLIKTDPIKRGLLCGIAIHPESFSRIDKSLMSDFPCVVSILCDDALCKLHKRKECFGEWQNAIAIAHEPAK